ncbi:SH2 domain-containing protein [Tieghemostelium lacteum]|uniref:SH2 domain-containing protein n=1 Tax=Tieghemostelium lacteum TaxID=361077 RepID=A0A151ZG20_TIELA|nr:SH2 domain-containing protein [Tieghemostelium lacteum]|eukprot:KYQ92859.1 SH2 domain-containing protein [Tieghemostelium lacteum]
MTSKKRVSENQIIKDDFEDENSYDRNPRESETFNLKTLEKLATPEELSQRKIAKVNTKYVESVTTEQPKTTNPFSSFSFGFKSVSTTTTNSNSTTNETKTTVSNGVINTPSKKVKSEPEVKPTNNDASNLFQLSNNNTSSLFSSTNTSSLFSNTTTTPLNPSQLFSTSNNTLPTTDPSKLFSTNNNTLTTSTIPSNLFTTNNNTLPTTDPSKLFSTNNNSLPTTSDPSKLFSTSNNTLPTTTDPSKLFSTSNNTLPTTTDPSKLFQTNNNNNNNIVTPAIKTLTANDPWKCMACENENPASTPQCTLCMSNNPNAPKPQLIKMTGLSAPIQTPNKPTVSANDPWKCMACENKNPANTPQCTLCMSNNPNAPKPQLIKMTGLSTPIETPLKTPLKTTTSASDPWKCMACEQQNPANTPQCTMCMSNNPNAPKPQLIKMSGIPEADKWVCSTCDAQNLGPGSSQCGLCHQPKIPLTPKPKNPNTIWICKACDTENELDITSCKLCAKDKTFFEQIEKKQESVQKSK